MVAGQPPARSHGVESFRGSRPVWRRDVSHPGHSSTATGDGNRTGDASAQFPPSTDRRLMRIVSLLPAGTEIVTALGCETLLVGISHECDYPASILQLPRVTRTPVDTSLSSARIDAQVREIQAEGKPVIALEAGVLETLAPDLILTQDLCEVCAVADGEVYRLADTMSSPPEIVPLRARDLG